MKISYKIGIIVKRGRPNKSRKENKLIKPHSPGAIVVNCTTAPNQHIMISYYLSYIVALINCY
jgi:hypothetical protein